MGFPLATGLPGLVLLAWTALYVVGPARAVHYIPLKAHNVGLGFAGLGTTGILGAAGVVLVMPLFFPSRWRRPATGDAGADDIGGEDEPIEATMVTSPKEPDWSREWAPVPGSRLRPSTPSSATTPAGSPADKR